MGSCSQQINWNHSWTFDVVKSDNLAALTFFLCDGKNSRWNFHHPTFSVAIASFPLLYQGGHRHLSIQVKCVIFWEYKLIGSQNYQRSLVFQCNEACFQVKSNLAPAQWNQDVLYTRTQRLSRNIGWGVVDIKILFPGARMYIKSSPLHLGISKKNAA